MKNKTTNYDSLLIPPGMRSPCNRLRITRICKINRKGYLISPTYYTVWTQPVMVAHKWSKSKALLGKCGLHGIWYHHDALPKVKTHAVVHRICGTEAPTSGTPEAGSQASDRRERDGYPPFRVGEEVPWAKDGLKISSKMKQGEEFSMRGYYYIV